ncbi:hypothetical protein PTKIN_Ptkin05aG0042100 [Pterospermum kingtungense]
MDPITSHGLSLPFHLREFNLHHYQQQQEHQFHHQNSEDEQSGSSSGLKKRDRDDSNHINNSSSANIMKATILVFLVLVKERSIEDHEAGLLDPRTSLSHQSLSPGIVPRLYALMSWK